MARQGSVARNCCSRRTEPRPTRVRTRLFRGTRHPRQSRLRGWPPPAAASPRHLLWAICYRSLPQLGQWVSDESSHSPHASQCFPERVEPPADESPESSSNMLDIIRDLLPLRIGELPTSTPLSFSPVTALTLLGLGQAPQLGSTLLVLTMPRLQSGHEYRRADHYQPRDRPTHTHVEQVVLQVVESFLRGQAVS